MRPRGVKALDRPSPLDSSGDETPIVICFGLTMPQSTLRVTPPPGFPRPGTNASVSRGPTSGRATVFSASRAAPSSSQSKLRSKGKALDIRFDTDWTSQLTRPRHATGCTVAVAAGIRRSGVCAGCASPIEACCSTEATFWSLHATRPKGTITSVHDYARLWHVATGNCTSTIDPLHHPRQIVTLLPASTGAGRVLAAAVASIVFVCVSLWSLQALAQ